MIPRRSARLLLLGLLLATAPAALPAQDIPTPESFFGFPMGADRKLARWDRMVEYYRLLGEASPRLRVVEMGPSTMGNPFLALFVSSPENLARLDELQGLNATLSDPRGASEAEIEDAIARGKAVVVQSMGLHATEVASSQMAVELVWDMVTRDDPEMARILDETVAILIPSFNPDGEVMVADWYRRTVGTEYEGTGLPWLYHKYIGHDNNRDAFQTNTVESQYGAKILFRDWVPQAYVDHHQMGNGGARMYVPPYADPIRPGGDPLVWREMSWYGAHIAYKEEEAGLSGIVNAAIYSGWGHFGFHWITPFHNIAGMLTEAASARLATPIFQHADELSGGRRAFPEYEAQTTFPHPWEGGWWRVRDIVDRQKVAALAILDIAARNRETVLRNAYLKAKRQTERGAEGDVRAFVIPAQQHDPLTMQEMVNKLLGQGIEVRRSAEGFTHGGRIYGPGSFVVTMAQPKRGVIRWLLGRTFYPDNEWTRDRDGDPIRPYDMSADVMAEFMGVRVDPVEEMPGTETEVVSGWLEPRGTVAAGMYGTVVDGRLNAAFQVVNRLFDEGVEVRRVTRAGEAGLRPGDFVVPASAPAELLSGIARETGVDFASLEADPSSVTRPATRLRIGLYKRYGGGNIDEGWTRLLLETWGFPYDSLMDARVPRGDLRADYDVIILPDDGLARMVGGGGGRGGNVPPEYETGFGEEGVAALEAFVEAGGTLVTFGEAAELPLQRFGLPVRNVLEGLSSTEFWSPGSTLRMRVDTGDPLAWGMPTDALATFLQGDHAYRITGGGERVRAVARYVDREVLQSGWLLGEEAIAGRAAMVEVGHGEGRVVLIGFRPQHRMQTHGTFKLVFNALIGGGEGSTGVAQEGAGAS